MSNIISESKEALKSYHDLMGTLRNNLEDIKNQIAELEEAKSEIEAVLDGSHEEPAKPAPKKAKKEEVEEEEEPAPKKTPAKTAKKKAEPVVEEEEEEVEDDLIELDEEDDFEDDDFDDIDNIEF